MHNIWTRFSGRNLWFRLDDFYSFFYNKNGIFSGVILPAFPDVCQGSLHSIDIPFRGLSCVISFNDPCDPLI